MIKTFLWVVGIVTVVMFIALAIAYAIVGVWPWTDTDPDPMHDDGTYRVGEDIEPGGYIIRPDNSDVTVYWARCADAACIVDFDFNDRTGMIDSDAFTTTSFLEVKASDYSVILNNVELEPLVLTPE